VAASSGRLVIAEDHHREGGLGPAVTDALLAAGHKDLSITYLAVRGLPDSGTGEELLAWAGIDTDNMAAVGRELVRNAAAQDRASSCLPEGDPGSFSGTCLATAGRTGPARPAGEKRPDIRLRTVKPRFVRIIQFLCRTGRGTRVRNLRG
jgi:hypothetical protein